MRLGSLLFLVAVPLSAQSTPPILDMHLHAMGANDQGPPPMPICTPFETFPAWDQRAPYPAVFMREVPCDDPLMSSATDDELRDETIAVMERLNVFGVLSGPTARVSQWSELAPGRFIPGLAFRANSQAPSPDSLRVLFESGSLAVLAEVTNQYSGIAPSAEPMAPYWDLAEELDMPVGIHMGPGPPGATYLADPQYRAALSNPLLLEDVLAAHPRLRVYVMHAGYPFLDEINALLYAHPQVYVEVGVIVFSQPRDRFYRYLRGMVEAGFANRIMFGSDQMNWPEAIARGVESIQEAPFLTEPQKRAILYDNAARFLRLSAAEQDRHAGR